MAHGSCPSGNPKSPDAETSCGAQGSGGWMMPLRAQRECRTVGGWRSAGSGLNGRGTAAHATARPPPPKTLRVRDGPSPAVLVPEGGGGGRAGRPPTYGARRARGHGVGGGRTDLWPRSRRAGPRTSPPSPGPAQRATRRRGAAVSLPTSYRSPPTTSSKTTWTLQRNGSVRGQWAGLRLRARGAEGRLPERLQKRLHKP